MGLLSLPVLDIVKEVIDRAIPDPKIKADLQMKLADLADKEAQREHDEMMGQIGTNTEEAKNSNLFVSGWRPAVGWICAVGIGYSFVVDPMATWIAQVIFHYKGAFPVLDSGQLMTLITGMLGFGGLRTYEKVKGVPDSTPVETSQPQSTVPTPIAQTPPKKKPLGGLWPF